MNSTEIIAKLKENEAALRARGVTHAALFGSRARGDVRPDSDTDIMIEIDPGKDMGVYEYVGLKDFIASLFDGPVDVVTRENLKPYVPPHSSRPGDACLLNRQSSRFTIFCITSTSPRRGLKGSRSRLSSPISAPCTLSPVALKSSPKRRAACRPT